MTFLYLITHLMQRGVPCEYLFMWIMVIDVMSLRICSYLLKKVLMVDLIGGISTIMYLLS